LLHQALRRGALRLSCGCRASLVLVPDFFGSTAALFVGRVYLPFASGEIIMSSAERFYGVRENKREIEMDMREMVDKVKRNEPLYGKSSLTPYMQGVASRNSRYSGVWLHVIPWFNFVNHEQVSYTDHFYE